uniref:MFS domain-containing protein n=1 Tax=Steinernema glaseri TaxID=37863 RepID=A0A1I8AN64_9BILA
METPLFKYLERINMTAAPGSSPSRWVPKATDGGWGWFVVVGSFLIHVFADGIVYSFGVMIDELMKEFGESNARVSIIVSLLTGLTLGVGPVASAITNKFGCRTTTITGALIATFGCGLSYFATSIEHLMITVGCIMGFGFGLMYCPAIVIVTMYFEKKRALATGIAVCGAGFGTLIFAPIIQYLINAFHWNTVFLFYACAVFACVACGSLFRPLEFVEVDEDGNEIL